MEIVQGFIIIISILTIISLLGYAVYILIESSKKDVEEKPYNFKRNYSTGSYHAPLKWFPSAGEYQCRFLINGKSIWGIPDTGSSDVVVLEKDLPGQSGKTGEKRKISYGSGTFSGEWYKGQINEHPNVKFLIGTEKLRGTKNPIQVNIYGLTMSNMPDDKPLIKQVSEPIVTFNFNPDKNADGYLIIGSDEGPGDNIEPLLTYPELNKLRGGEGVLWNTVTAVSIKVKGEELLEEGEEMQCMFDTGTTYGGVPSNFGFGSKFQEGDKLEFTFKKLKDKMTLTVGSTIVGGQLLGKKSLLIGNQWMKGQTISWDFKQMHMRWA